MIELASKHLCTGCGACMYPCPKQCIEMKEDSIGQVYPVIDRNVCIECHACEKICPVLNEPQGYTPQKAYAAWSNDTNARSKSASGGIAHELYRYAVREGYKVVGASINDDFTVTLKIADTEEGVLSFKNSKYVFSSGITIFKELGELLKKGEKVLAMGVPCQIAAMRKMYKNNENLILVEILCHGMTPHSYLQQHIKKIEAETYKKAKTMSFRDPAFQTENYTFTLYDNKDECFYSARTKEGDSYQYGYHRGISYRDNCYHCKFAKEERVGDLILCDFYGLGTVNPCEYTHKKVSCVIVNNHKGDSLFEKITQNHNIFFELRPLQEAVSGNPRLKKPTEKGKPRAIFEQRILNFNGDFEKAIAPLANKYMKDSQQSILRVYTKAIFNKIKKFIYR